jgi:hypothetical protein
MSAQQFISGIEKDTVSSDLENWSARMYNTSENKSKQGNTKKLQRMSLILRNYLCIYSF